MRIALKILLANRQNEVVRSEIRFCVIFIFYDIILTGLLFSPIYSEWSKGVLLASLVAAAFCTIYGLRDTYRAVFFFGLEKSELLQPRHRNLGGNP